MKYSTFFKLFLVLLICIVNFTEAANQIVRFGAIADPQWADRDSEGSDDDHRFYRESKEKLIKCLDALSNENLDFIITLGDIVDVQWDGDNDKTNNIDEILKVYKNFNLNDNVKYEDFMYFVIGNHEYSSGSSKECENPVIKLGINLVNNTENNNIGYYTFKKKGYKFIVLDGVETYHRVPFGMSKTQIEWFENELINSSLDNTPTVIFSHFPIIDNSATPKPHTNASEILNIIDKYPCVRTYINGHLHQGLNPVRTINGTWHLSLNGMVHGSSVGLNNTYYIIEINEESIIVDGYGDGENDDNTHFNRAILPISAFNLLLDSYQNE